MKNSQNAVSIPYLLAYAGGVKNIWEPPHLFLK